MREHAVADIQRVAKEVAVDDVGNELFARWPFNRDLDVGSLIFDRVDLAEKRIDLGGCHSTVSRLAYGDPIAADRADKTRSPDGFLPVYGGRKRDTVLVNHDCMAVSNALHGSGENVLA